MLNLEASLRGGDDLSLVNGADTINFFSARTYRWGMVLEPSKLSIRSTAGNTSTFPRIPFPNRPIPMPLSSILCARFNVLGYPILD